MRDYLRESGNRTITLGHRRRRGLCFCADGCRWFTRPFDQYWVQSFAAIGPDYPTPVLFRASIFYELNCRWDAVTDHFPGPSVEALEKQVVQDPVTMQVIGFKWQLTLTDPGGINVWSLTEIPGEYVAIPVDHEGFGSCDRMEYKLSHDVLGETFPAFLWPAYPDACDDTDYPAKRQTKEVTWQP